VRRFTIQLSVALVRKAYRVLICPRIVAAQTEMANQATAAGGSDDYFVNIGSLARNHRGADFATGRAAVNNGHGVAIVYSSSSPQPAAARRSQRRSALIDAEAPELLVEAHARNAEHPCGARPVTAAVLQHAYDV